MSTPLRIDKDLVAASATPLVLGILAEEETHGYAILKKITDLSGGRLAWTDGMLYPLLHRLERSGQVAATWGVSETGRRRKVYAITATGRAALAERHGQWQVISEALDRIWDRFGELGGELGGDLGGGLGGEPALGGA